ncbi:hypothetical protein ERO13_D12G198266v2 [Gossypium hirsutum]|uniref:Pectinesterase n=1 Tax=Gossypium mustelinum TaxID=34275 RepID=A0A5D2SJ04_GOSMU|nr:hypothetical protein ERO13_D12G198266v2 [Gossypium hirsutum]TYI52128.1 hypothetical protein E1A91_D12G225100v1 [Gossypium mustelinum]
MAGKIIKGSEVYVATMCVSILLFAPIIVSQLIPADKSQVNSWFNGIIKSVKERDNTLNPELGGGGEFDTITKAIKSVPSGNTKRVIISIRPRSYKEKIRIERNKPFITLLRDPQNMPNLTFDSTSKQYGTIDSATLITECSYFVGANLNLLNTAPRPDGKMVGAQVVALRVSGDRSTFYNCKIFGFQDTLCDDRGNHFFKDCHIRGTIDFIFGSGKSLYLNTKIFVEGDPGLTLITAQVRESSSEDTGYSFVHGSIFGTTKNAYTEMGNVVNPVGWSHNLQPERAKTIYYGEYKCTGQGANPKT